MPAAFTSPVRPRPAAPGPQPQAVPAGTLALRYLARSPVLVRGPATGREYRFSAAQPVQRVARGDSDALLRTGHFRLDAGVGFGAT